MKKNYVLDTNVLLYDPHAIYKFEDNDLIIPIYVIEEIDQFKREGSERGRNARSICRFLDELRERGSLSAGVALDSGGSLRVAVPAVRPELASALDKAAQDQAILQTAIDVRDHAPERPTIFVTMDTNLRIRADAVGVSTENYENQKVDIEHIDRGIVELDVDPQDIDLFFHEGSLAPPPDIKLHANTCVLLRDTKSPSHTALGRYHHDRGMILPLRVPSGGIMGLRPRNKEQTFALELLLDNSIRLVCVLGKAGTGKAQPLDARVLTPDGWRRMGQIEPGHKVMTPDGTAATVLAVFPQGTKDIYRVRFTDGSSTECCREHLWYTQTTLNRDQHKPGSVKSLEEIMGCLRYGAQQKRNHSIPLTAPVPFGEKTFPLDPYLLGCLLGDGSISVGHPSLTSADAFLIAECEPLLAKVGCSFGSPQGYTYPILSGTTGAPAMGFVRRDPATGEEKTYKHLREVVADGFSCTSVYRACSGKFRQHKGFEWRSIEPTVQSSHAVKNALMELELWGHRAEEKCIPEAYLLGSIEQRIALLQGLMDTDGTIDKRGCCSFSTTSPRLVEGFRFLVQSLGGTVTVQMRQTSYTHKGEKRVGRPSFTCMPCLPEWLVPFRLPRKVARLRTPRKYKPRRHIDCVEFVGRKEAKCILIDHPEHLYITDDFIVTHNTLLATAAGLKRTIEDEVYSRLLVSRPVIPMGRDVGYLPGDIGEKLNPWMQPIYDNLEQLLAGRDSKHKKDGSRTFQELQERGQLHVEPLTYIRGRSLPHQYLIVDEAQNLTPHEVKTIITRCGEGTKVVLTGDPFQIDNPYVDSTTNGLSVAAHRFKGQPLAAHIMMMKGERSELAEIAANLL
jgi:predicted ribonuclease YlaK